MGCTGSHTFENTWLDDKFNICNHHTLTDSHVDDIMKYDLDSAVNFNTAFSSPWWITFEFKSLICEVGGIVIASCRSESSPRLTQIMTSLDNQKWKIVGSIFCDSPWGTGAVGTTAIGNPSGNAVKEFGINPPICAKYIRIRVLETYDDCGPWLHYIRFTKNLLQSNLNVKLEPQRDTGVDVSSLMTPTEKIPDSAHTSWTISEADACDPKHPSSNLSKYDCKTYVLFSTPEKSTSKDVARGPWAMVLEIKQMIYELVALELVAYIDTDSPRVVQIEISRDKVEWTFLAAFECAHPWGSGHRMPSRPHPTTMEVNVGRTQVGSSTMHWRLPSCLLKYPQFVRVNIAQTFSGQPPSLHYLKLSHRVGRPRAQSTPDITYGRPLQIVTSDTGISRPIERSLSEEDGETDDVLGPLLTSSSKRRVVMRRLSA